MKKKLAQSGTGLPLETQLDQGIPGAGKAEPEKWKWAETNKLAVRTEEELKETTATELTEHY